MSWVQLVRAQHPPRRFFDANPSPGFDYEFNSIEDGTNELFCAYKEMFELAVSQNKNPLRQFLGIYLPIINVVFVSEPRGIGPGFRPHRK